MENANAKILEQRIIEMVSNSKLPISTVYYLFENITSQLRSNYDAVARQELEKAQEEADKAQAEKEKEEKPETVSGEVVE